MMRCNLCKEMMNQKESYNNKNAILVYYFCFRCRRIIKDYAYNQDIEPELLINLYKELK